MTRFGKKSKPFFKVVDWRGGDANDTPRQIESKGGSTERVYDDAVPF
jgi:hypothetical protein